MLLLKFNGNRHEIDHLFENARISDVTPVLKDLKDKHLTSDLSKSLNSALNIAGVSNKA